MLQGPFERICSLLSQVSSVYLPKIIPARANVARFVIINQSLDRLDLSDPRVALSDLGPCNFQVLGERLVFLGGFI